MKTIFKGILAVVAMALLASPLSAQKLKKSVTWENIKVYVVK